jgi:hypothetical protein
MFGGKAGAYPSEAPFRFHGILPKEYSRKFHGIPWGLYKEMPTDTMGQSDILTHSTYI